METAWPICISGHVSGAKSHEKLHHVARTLTVAFPPTGKSLKACYLWPWPTCLSSATPPPPHPHSPISDLSSLILLLWSLADIFCHNPDAALLQSLLAFSWLLPCSAGCLFWTKPTLVCVWPLVSGIPTLLVTAGWLGTMKSLSVFRPHSPSPQGGRFSKTMEAFSISGTIWAARQEDGRTKRQRVRETS